MAGTPEDCARRVNQALAATGHADFIVSAVILGSQPLALVTAPDGRVAEGTPEVFIRAIADAQEFALPLDEVFAARGLFD